MTEKIAKLIIGCLQKTISPEEMKELRDWSCKHPYNREILDQFLNDKQILSNVSGIE